MSIISINSSSPINSNNGYRQTHQKVVSYRNESEGWQKNFPNKWYLAEAILRDSQLGKKDELTNDDQNKDVITRALTHINTRTHLEGILKKLDPENHITEEEKDNIEKQIPRKLKEALKFACICKIFHSVLYNVNEFEAKHMADESQRGKILNLDGRRSKQKEFNRQQESTYATVVYNGKKSFNTIAQRLIIETLENKARISQLKINTIPDHLASDTELEYLSDKDEERKVPEMKEPPAPPAFSITIEDTSERLS